MYASFKKKIAINLVIGSLGAGKTTLLKNLLQNKPENENWGILVNEFGAIGIDGAILSNQHDSVQIAQIPGGCICCTALSDFKSAIQQLLDNYSLDRIFIEPTGLGEPDSMVDLIQSSYFQQHFELQTVFALLDSATTKIEHFSQLVIMQNLVDVADVIVLNKQDRAPKENIAALNRFIEQLYPPKAAIINTSQSKIDPGLVNINSSHQESNSAKLINSSSKEAYGAALNEEQTEHSEQDLLLGEPYDKLKGLVDRKCINQLNTLSIGWVFSNDVTFDWSRLFNLFKTFQKASENQQPLRAKGVFKVGEPRMLFQWVTDQEISREYIAYKRDSRIELLLPAETKFQFEAFEAQLAQCQK